MAHTLGEVTYTRASSMLSSAVKPPAVTTTTGAAAAGSVAAGLGAGAAGAGAGAGGAADSMLRRTFREKEPICGGWARRVMGARWPCLGVAAHAASPGGCAYGQVEKPMDQRLPLHHAPALLLTWLHSFWLMCCAFCGSRELGTTPTLPVSPTFSSTWATSVSAHRVLRNA